MIKIEGKEMKHKSHYQTLGSHHNYQWKQDDELAKAGIHGAVRSSQDCLVNLLPSLCPNYSSRL